MVDVQQVRRHLSISRELCPHPIRGHVSTADGLKLEVVESRDDLIELGPIPIDFHRTRRDRLVELGLLKNHLAQELTRADLPAPVLEKLEQAIIIAFLCTNENNFSMLLKTDPKDCAPSKVRMAEEFIEANWSEAMTIEKLFDITNTSASSLFRSIWKSARIFTYDSRQAGQASPCTTNAH